MKEDDRLGKSHRNTRVRGHPKINSNREVLMVVRNIDEYQEALKEMSRKAPNIDKALSLLRHSLRRGNPNAAYALGTWHLPGEHLPQDRKKAIALLRQAAKHNVPNALFDMAVCYEKGVGVRKSLASAFEYYLRAALHGEKQSVYEVGRCYYYGVGASADRKVAKIWLGRAHELGITK